MNRTVTVVIPTRNRAPILERTLEAYLAQVGELGGEVIVVDDGSTDATASLLERKAAENPDMKFRIINPRGPAAARNRALDLAEGDLILFTGDDMIPSPGLLQGHVRAQQSVGNAAVVGRVEWDPACNPTLLMRLMAPNGPLFNYKKLRARRGALCRFFYTANLSIPTNLLGSDRFNEAFTNAAFEDVELGHRLLLRGVRLEYEENLIVWHHHPMNANQLKGRLRTMAHARDLLEGLHPELATGPLARVKDAALQCALCIWSLVE